VSNAVDAIQKIKHLARTGEFKEELGDLRVDVAVDKEAKTITISDTGLGMTGEEVKKYLNVVAFSGAEEFIKKYKDAGEQGDIIGKFGLGFYSAFMVAEKVEVVSKSHQEGAEAIRWINDGSIEFSLETAEREKRGTDVILHVAKSFSKTSASATYSTSTPSSYPSRYTSKRKSSTIPIPSGERLPATWKTRTTKSFSRSFIPWIRTPCSGSTSM